MEDNAIVALYWERSEEAIRESALKYGGYCSVVARNILGSREDAEECVNDTWMRAWNAIPPDRPRALAAYFASITRRLALDRWRRGRSAKAGGGRAAICLDELEECVGSNDPGEEAVARIALKSALDRFLAGLKPEAREIFMRRYWAFSSEREIARDRGMSVEAVRMSLSRTRKLLKETLEKEEIGI